MRNPLNRELVATFEIIVSVHDNASDVIDMSVSVPNGEIMLFIFISSLVSQSEYSWMPLCISPHCLMKVVWLKHVSCKAILCFQSFVL